MALPTTHRFETAFAVACPTREWCDWHVVLAVSAGADSVAMLRAAATLKQSCGGKGKLYVAHLNHSLRGTEADGDAVWLEQLCGRLGMPIEIGKVDVSAMAAAQGDGVEAAARSARYEFLTEVAERLGARFVAMAHTADDQVETVLQRILRGTGLAGLSGIPAVRPLSPSVVVVRPLLGMRRRDVIDYLTAISQDYRTDSTNADPRWTRNRLRLELLPLLRARYNSEVDAALSRLAIQANELQELVVEMAKSIARDCVAVETGFDMVYGRPIAVRVQLDCRRLAAEPLPIIREVCKLAWMEANWPQQAMGFDEWQQLALLVREECPLTAINLPGNLRTGREKNVVVVETARHS